MRVTTAGCLRPLLPTLLVFSAIGLLTPHSAAAQSTCPNPCVLTVGQTYSLAADHDGVSTTGYRIYIDSVKVGNDLPLSALSSGVVTVASLTAPARGAHTIQVSAFNADNETKSDPFAFTVKLPAPTKPGNVRILIAVVVAEDGTTTFQIVGIEPIDPVK